MQRGIFVLAVLLIVSASSVYAAQKGPKGHQPKTMAVSKPAVKVHAKPVVKAHVKPATKTHVKPATKTHVKTSVKTAKVTATTTKAAKAPKTQTATTTTGPIVTLSPVQQKLQRNTNLAAKLQGRLPAGTDLMAAAAGFRNLGQFVSTVNASHNHELSFTALKTRIVDQGMSLGQAMQDLR
jgi:hypothetical protein